MKKKKVFVVISELILNLLLIVSLSLIAYRLFDSNELEIEYDILNGFLLPFGLFLILYFLIYVFSIVFHELGHLLFGLNAKLKFISFSVLFVKIEKVRRRLSIGFTPIINGTLGYCSMEFTESKKYKKNSVILYFLGGIIANLFLVIVSSIFYFSIEDNVIQNTMLFIICINSYLALNNALPKTLMSGISSDMQNIIMFNNDPEFTKIYGRFNKIRNYINRGKKLKDLDEDLFYMPSSFKYNSDIDMGILYIDYLIDKGSYSKAVKNIDIINDKCKNKLDESQINILKLQKIECIYYDKKDIKEVRKIFDKSLLKYIKVVKKINPSLIVFEYMYYKLIDKDKNKVNKIKIDVKRIISKLDTNSKKEVIDYIKRIDESN